MVTKTKIVAAISTLSLALIATPSPATQMLAGGDHEYVRFTASNGLSSQYHVYADSIQQPAGLLIWTHGDGAYEFTHPRSPYVMGGLHGVRALVKAQGYILVSALSPDTDGTVTWWEDGEANADYMADLINHLTSTYSIDSSNIVLAGFSGGAQFTTQYFLPEYSELLQGGGSIVFGGGGAPETSQQTPWNEALKSNFYMHWVTGELDTAENSDEDYDALAYAMEGKAYYTAEGFATTSYWVPNTGHELDGLFGDLLATKLWEHNRHGGTGPVPPAAPSPSLTNGKPWAYFVEPSAERAYVTVNTPVAFADQITRVRAEGPNGYWFEDFTGSGEHTVQLGDPGTPYWDPLLPSTKYNFWIYTITNASTNTEHQVERAFGAFTTTSKDSNSQASSITSAKPKPFLGSTNTSFAIKVHVKSTDSSQTPEGKITVLVGGKSFSADLAGGQTVVQIGKYARGIYPIKVMYEGSANVAPSTAYTAIIVLR